MANIIEIIYREYVAMYKRNILIVFLLILFIIAGAYAYKWYAAPVIDKKPYDDVANANRQEKPINIMFFSAEWCPHCIKAKPQWKTFSDEYNGKTINGYTINCIHVDCTNGETDSDVQSYIQKYSIEHYPTVKLINSDTTVDFDASVTSSNLLKFVESSTQ